MVEVFKTNVQDMDESEVLIYIIQKQVPNSCITFDLDDCDNVLRVEAEDISPKCVIDLLNNYGYLCEML